MSSITEIRQKGSILQRKSRGRIWNNDIPSNKIDPKKKKNKHKKMKHANEDFWKVWENENQ